ncbi:MAG TPA: phenylalanine--tRNA ligase subunit beta, partial [candidate division Zixibacteria bacterium]|nr:phenylalanine--tRNA ligase subunit beta [candidate division Zixibacteria bacterium]
RFGVQSQCMIASERELELSDDHSGIMVLPADAVVGTPLAEALGLCDYTLEFELTPNRADSMSALGIARDVAALAEIKLRRPQFTVSESGEKTRDQLTVEIDDPQFCPRYIGRIIRDVTIGPSPAWLSNRLLASGLTPINNIVDITNYVMLEYGQPLHAFDLAHFPAGKIVVRRARPGVFTTLDGVERTVDETVLMITNGAEDLAAGGVMGGLKSSITETTTDVLLEGANFDPALIRKSRLKLGLQTDASQRFEKGVDPNITREAVDRATQLLVELAGGTALAGAADNYARRIEPQTIELRIARLNKILGTELTRERAAEILSGLELGVETGSTEILRVTAPTFRPDLEREIDLIEEVARIIGFDNIPTTTGYLALYPADREAQVLREKTVEEIRRTALACGFDEICGSGLADERALEALDPGAPQVRLANPISDEFSSLRNSLAYSLLAAARTNVTHQVTSVQLFELGKVYAPKLDGEFHERERLGLLVTGEAEAFWRGGRGAPLDYYWLK